MRKKFLGQIAYRIFLVITNKQTNKKRKKFSYLCCFSTKKYDDFQQQQQQQEIGIGIKHNQWRDKISLVCLFVFYLNKKYEFFLLLYGCYVTTELLCNRII